MDGVIRLKGGEWKGVKCGIGVLCDAQWVWKYDGADETDIEATKAVFR